MISEGTFLERLEARRCIVQGTELLPDEVVVSRNVAPHIYGAARTRSDETGLVQAIATSLNIIGALGSRPRIDEGVRAEIRRFWARVLSNADASSSAREDVIHAYLYHFWDDLWEDTDCERLSLEERYIPKDEKTWDRDSNFCVRLAGKFRARADVDIVARSGTTVYLIEVKFEDVDDRAVGQLLRYFDQGRYLSTHTDHLCDLRRVIPVMVARVFPDQFWTALPTSFRELMRIYFWKIENDRVVLSDARKQIRARMQGLKRSAY
jgi:hypothetical protein